MMTTNLVLLSFLVVVVALLILMTLFQDQSLTQFSPMNHDSLNGGVPVSLISISTITIKTNFVKSLRIGYRKSPQSDFVK